MNAQTLDKRAGLTLAELMIALVIGGMALVITAQAASTVQRWTTRLARAEDNNTKIAGLYQFAETMLSGAVPMVRVVEKNTIALFEGNEYGVRFVRVEPGYPSRAGLYQYHIFSEEAQDGEWSLRLERELLTSASQFGTPKNPDELVIFTGEQAPTFSFSGGGGWQNDWVDQGTPPTLVRFGIAEWPALSIALPRPRPTTGAEKNEAADSKAAPQKAEVAK